MREETRPLKYIDMPDLFSKLSNVKQSAQFVTLHTMTIPAFKAKSVYKGRVTKRQNHNVQINADYTNAVNNQRVKEGNMPSFVASKPVWGTKIPNTPLIEHNGNYYLRTRVLSSSQADYYLDGVFVDMIPLRDAITNDITPANSNALHQGIVAPDNEVIIRNFKLESIRAISIDKVLYVIEK